MKGSGFGVDGGLGFVWVLVWGEMWKGLGGWVGFFGMTGGDFGGYCSLDIS